jgi:hypothetical protein
LCNVQAILTNGLLRIGELAGEPDESFSYEYVHIEFFRLSNPGPTWTFRRQRREHTVFQALLQMVPGLEERIMESNEEDVVTIAELVSHDTVPVYSL